MSRDYVERIADAAYDALLRRDLDDFLALVHPEAEFRSLIAEIERRTYRGHGARSGTPASPRGRPPKNG